MRASGGLRAFPVGPLSRPVEAFKVANCDGSDTPAPVVRSAQTVVNPEDVARVQTDGC